MSSTIIAEAQTVAPRPPTGVQIPNPRGRTTCCTQGAAKLHQAAPARLRLPFVFSHDLPRVGRLAVADRPQHRRRASSGEPTSNEGKPPLSGLLGFLVASS